MLTINVSAVLNEIIEVKKDISYKANKNQENTISGKFKRLIIIIKALRKLKKDLKLIEYSYPKMDLNSKMEYYAELSYMAENSKNEIESFLLSKPVTSLFDKIFIHFGKSYIKILANSEQKVFNLTYPENKSLDDPEYVAQLNQDYANAPQYHK